MVLLILGKHTPQPPGRRIYIPLWFYLYLSLQTKNLWQSYLHSTMVLLILLIATSPSASTAFTFHYGSTYTVTRGSMVTRRSNLHSTMVLLILRCIVIPAASWSYLHSTMVLLILEQMDLDTLKELFTFHYGSTYTSHSQIKHITRNTFTFHYGSTYTAFLHLLLLLQSPFTFHYGSTYTIRADEERCRGSIYIPLWFYLYNISQCFYSRGYYIYIPLWFYLYQIALFTISMQSFIYIPLWFYLYNQSWIMLRVLTHLHSTMVLLIRTIGCWLYWACIIYIPLWFYLYISFL